MRKMLASDIDGTLVIDGKIHEKSISRLKELRERGHALILCTGRDFSNVEGIFDGHDIDVDALVLCNGALILNKDFKEEKALNIDKNVVKSIHSYIRGYKEYNIGLIDGYAEYRDTAENLPVEGYNVNIVDTQELERKYDSIKLISVEEKSQCVEKAEELKNYINNTYGELVIAYRNMYFVDVVPKGCSKALGIESVTGKFDIVEDNVFVIGDSWNDLSMFEKYKNSYTFTHCEEELKKSANNIVDNFYKCVEDIIA